MRSVLTSQHFLKRIAYMDTHVSRTSVGVHISTRALGLTDIRQRLVGQTRVIYQLDGTQVYVHMFVSTLRDFMAQLTGRLL